MLQDCVSLASAGEERAVVRAYHELSKHQLQRYAPGPETLDWDSRPAPFRRFVGADGVSLPRIAEASRELADALTRPLSELGAAAPRPFSLAALGALFELSLGITAWKSQGPDRWAVRANPSSGNLHPIEGYALVSGVSCLADGVYHYRAEDHVLERRARWQPAGEGGAPARVWVALTSIMWREAWKYGERAFRYCQLDTGHALAAFGYAAALLGWRVREESRIGWATLRHALGLDRSRDFAQVRRPDTEEEEPELLVAVDAGAASLRDELDPGELRELARSAVFAGQASVIDPYPMYSWPALAAVAAATRWPDTSPGVAAPEPPRPALPPSAARATGPSVAQLILERRSAQRFDRRFVLPRPAFAGLLQALLPGASPAASGLPRRSSLELVLFVHRVEGLEPGVYSFPRASDPEGSLAGWLEPRFALRQPQGFVDSPALFELARLPSAALERSARQLHCHQDIAKDACFAVAMLTDLERGLSAPRAYRRLLREAGRLGQILYLEAEAAGVRGTGIGCFFDDAVAELLGLQGMPVRSLYHFSVGKALDDPRIETTWSARWGEAGTGA